MSDLKNGDIVELTSGLVNNLYHGDRLKFITSDGDSALLSQTIIVSKHIFKKVEEFKPDYETSNRYKLSQFIKAQPYKAVELSVSIGHQATYLSSTASKSRFESRGDISDAQLHKIANEVNSKVLELKSTEEHSEDLKEKSYRDAVDEADMIRNKVREAFKSSNKKPFNLDSYTPIQCRDSKSIQVSKKVVLFTVFLITVLIVSLLAALIYLA